MKILYYLMITVFLFVPSSFTAGEDTILVGFWNLENLFDTVDDTLKIDEEFLPNGDKQWTEERLDIKYKKLSEVILSMGNGKGPGLLGVCEVEHQAPLDSLVSKYLSSINYKIVYAESPDERGIDNGLIYNADLFTLISVSSDTVVLSDSFATRLILHSVLRHGEDTLHVFVNHWPSRRGGENESEKNRIAAGTVLRNKVDQLFLNSTQSNIIIIGDFNDEPANVSVIGVLKAMPMLCTDALFPANMLFNTSFEAFQLGQGTYKFRDDWNMLDQIIVSGALLDGAKIDYVCGSFSVYKPDVMVTKSGKYEGTPFPTYGGKSYLGGYSDHFPVTAKFLVRKEK